ncbi:flagellar hook-length control protein FliK [Sphaerotilus sp.]|uniref:flagellar hook-length control protein FliK n=1 Tax=Sphaerotilus sp. TaxID=2093942 RepID=UPI00286E7685|nr:flagellar hook-length control protein FliK [Sphaerotilus sp.]
MDSPLSILTPQAPRPDRLPGRGPAAGAADTADEPGGFARALTVAAATRATPDAAAGPALGGADADANAAAVTTEAPAPDVVIPVATLLLRRALSPERGAEAARPDARGRAAVAGAAGGADLAVSDVVEPEAAAGKSPRPESADTSDTLASAGTNTALMQWMLQMAPQPPAPVAAQPPQPAESARVGLGRQDGAALLQQALPVGLLGRPESASRDTDTRSSGLGARTAGSGVSAVEFPGVATRPAGVLSAASPDAAAAQAAFPGHKPVDAVGAVPLPVAAAPSDAARVVDPLQPKASTASATSAADAQALLPSAAQSVAAAAVATSTASVTPAGSPVVAPAQTWIQTPVTQPGFSNEVVVELVRRVGQAEQGTQALTLHLNPVELGPVSVSIELNGSAARIEFGASEALTRHHLEAALPGLTEALRDEGVSLTHSGVHEASKESLAASAAGGQASGGTGSDGRQRGEALFDGRSGYGERAPRRETEVFSIDGRAAAGARAPVALVPSPGRAGRLDLFA